MKNYIKEREQQNNMKKYIFTESQIKKIIDTQINEQTFHKDQIEAINAGSEDFLTNVKKIQGKDLTDKITKYQRSIGCEVTGHMLDCVDLMRKNHMNDFLAWKKSIQKNKPLLDAASDGVKKMFMKLFNIQPNSDDLY